MDVFVVVAIGTAIWGTGGLVAAIVAILRLRAERRDLALKVRQVQAEIRKAQAVAEKLNIESIGVALTNLRNDYDRMDVENGNLRKRIALLEAKNRQLQRTVRDLEDENTNLTKRVTELEQEKRQLQDALENHPPDSQSAHVSSR